VAALSVAAPAAHAAATRPPAPRCADADLLPTADDLPAIRAALVCLHNQERVSRGLHPLENNAHLQAVATAHSNEKVADGCVAHASAGGTSFSTRIIRGGYGARSARLTLGENLACATGGLATPASLMDAWMHSPGHRANILTRAYRDIGIGLGFGGADAHLTVTADFGARR
jgi:uncharacterized protein YkwD